MNSNELDHFLTVVYVTVDDIYIEQFASLKPIRPGARPEMSDSEVMTLALLSQWCGKRSERWMLDYAGRNWLSYFPRLLQQSAFNRRVRDLAIPLCALGPLVAQRVTEQLDLDEAYELVDGVPVPIMRRCRGDQHKLFANEADIGKGGADKEYYYGVKLMPMVNQSGLITGFVFGPASTEERFLAEALFRTRHNPEAEPPTGEEMDQILGPTHKRGGQRVGPNGPIALFGVGTALGLPCISDLGLRGAEWQAHWLESYGVPVLTKDAYDNLPPTERKKARHWLSGLRQPVETTFQWLTNDLGLKFPRARSWWGLLARLGAKISAFNLALMFNYLTGRLPYSLFDPIRA